MIPSGSYKNPKKTRSLWRFLVWFLTSSYMLIGIVRAQDYVGIATRARTEAETEVRRNKAQSFSRSARSGPTVIRVSSPMSAFGQAAGFAGRPRQRLTTAAKFSKVHGARSVPPAYNDAAQVFQTTANSYLERTGTSARAAASSTSLTAGFRQALSDICPRVPHCDPFWPWRYATGRCNNLLYPLQGSEMTPQPRLLYAAYEDAFQLKEPRQHGVGGGLLPSARDVSNKVHRAPGGEIPEFGITLFLMQWGQFTDHDITLTPIPTEADEKPIVCAKGGVLMGMHPECFPIKIDQPDPFFPPGYEWMNFVRSTPAINTGCFPGQRQQLNKLTSYIDASNVYGSTDEEQQRLRGPTLSGMLDSRGGNLPEDHTPGAPNCDVTDPEYCLLAGDERVMEQPSLSMIHTAFLREHNRIALLLAGIQPGWDDERLFQETRAIVAAQMQHITYNEYLPLLLGPDYTNAFRLYSTPSGFNHVYSQFIDASIVNVFAAASYRYGHSQVPNILGKTEIIHNPPSHETPLEDHYFDSKYILQPEGADEIARFTASANSQSVDSQIEQSIRDKLFQDGTDSLDLPALNIQRGRDHGLPPYNEYRVLCGRRPYLRWEDAYSDHTSENVVKLMAAYSDPRDIDMFTGALTEKPVPGGYVGPTNACIIGNQFWRLKRGDRFFYENPFPITGFTLDQLNSIKTTSLARIICNNMNTHWIQPNIFRKAGIGNQRVDCATLPDIDLSLWSDTRRFSGYGPYLSSVSPPASPVSALRYQRPPRFSVYTAQRVSP